MEKNENGYSDFNFSTPTKLNCRGEYNENMNDAGEKSCLQGKPLAMVYSPSQEFRMMYSPMEALNHGTLFEELYKPLLEDRVHG